MSYSKISLTRKGYLERRNRGYERKERELVASLEIFIIFWFLNYKVDQNFKVDGVDQETN